MTGMTENLPSQWNSGRLATVKPNIILIMLGTNDIGVEDVDVENAPDRLANYIDQIYNQPEVGNPSIFVASIPPNRRSARETTDVIDFNTTVPGIVSAQQALGRDVNFVDQFTPLNDNFDTAFRPDRLHPNATGNVILAQQWFNSIAAAASEPEPKPGQTIYFGDAASEGQSVLAGDDGYSLPVLTIVNLSDGNSAGPVIYTAPADQTLQLTEVNFFTGNIGATGATAVATGNSGNLTPFVVRILGADADGGFNGQQASSFEILAVGDAITTADVNTLINGAFTVGGANPSISLNAGDRIAAGFLSDQRRMVLHDQADTQGVGEYINNGDSLTDATDGALTGNSDFDFDRAMSFNIGFVIDDGPVLHGDVNLDGMVNFLDISPFISVLSAGGEFQAEADCNLDGAVSFLDIAPFIVALSNQ